MIIDVTKEDIKKGQPRGKGKACVIEYAIARTFDVEPARVRWGYTAGTFIDRKGKHRAVVVHVNDQNKVTAAVFANDSRNSSRRAGIMPFSFRTSNHPFLFDE